MIVDFGVKNFRSIRDLETFAMNAAKIVSKDKELDERNMIHVSDKLSLLKTKAIYGANASGKSTMIRALSAFMKIVVNSVKDENVLQTEVEWFRLLQQPILTPTYFQLSFIFKDVLYRYGFEANRNEVTAEWLFGTPGKKEVFFFIRKGKEIDVNENQFAEGTKVVDIYKQSNNDIARPNALFLTVVRSFGQGLASELIDYFSSYIIIPGLTDFRMHETAEEVLANEEGKRKITELLRLADTGIEDLMRREYKEGSFLTITKHTRFDKEGQPAGTADLYMLIDESEGTRKMFELSPALFQTLELNTVLVIDEFDARFHPLLSRKIVELFNSSNNKGAQLIFATHDTNLLSPKLLRRDQIGLVEKDKFGASHFYSLADFKGVRNDASYEKDYIAGRYGAIPFLGDFKSIMEA